MKTTDNKNVVNVENTKAAIEATKELTESEMLNAYLANHAIDHYCDAIGAEREVVESILTHCGCDESCYYLYTQPAIGGKRSDGKDNPTKDEWEKLNPNAIFVETLAGKHWYKRRFIIGDARGVRSVVNGYTNYLEARDNAQKKVDNILSAAAALLGISVEELKAKSK